MKKIYLCCEQEEKKRLKEKAWDLYKNIAVITEILWKADVMLLVGKPDEIMLQEIKMAEELKIETLQVTPELVDIDTFNMICDNKMSTFK